jgi:hypothetical protein
MPRPERRPILARGAVMGCWTVLRDSTPVPGGRRYYCRASCCGQERPITICGLMRKPETCVHCKSKAQRKAVAS